MTAHVDGQERIPVGREVDTPVVDLGQTRYLHPVAALYLLAIARYAFMFGDVMRNGYLQDVFGIGVEVRKMTGNFKVPTLVLDDGTAIDGSEQIVHTPMSWTSPTPACISRRAAIAFRSSLRRPSTASGSFANAAITSSPTS